MHSLCLFLWESSTGLTRAIRSIISVTVAEDWCSTIGVRKQKSPGCMRNVNGEHLPDYNNPSLTFSHMTSEQMSTEPDLSRQIYDPHARRLHATHLSVTTEPALHRHLRKGDNAVLQHCLPSVAGSNPIAGPSLVCLSLINYWLRLWHLGIVSGTIP